MTLRLFIVQVMTWNKLFCSCFTVSGCNVTKTLQDVLVKQWSGKSWFFSHSCMTLGCYSFISHITREFFESFFGGRPFIVQQSFWVWSQIVFFFFFTASDVFSSPFLIFALHALTSQKLLYKVHPRGKAQLKHFDEQVMSFYLQCQKCSKKVCVNGCNCHPVRTYHQNAQSCHLHIKCIFWGSSLRFIFLMDIDECSKNLFFPLCLCDSSISTNNVRDFVSKNK